MDPIPGFPNSDTGKQRVRVTSRYGLSHCYLPNPVARYLSPLTVTVVLVAFGSIASIK